MLKKNIEYNLSGVNELIKDKEKNKSKLEMMLFSIENKIPELIEFSNKTLDYAGVDIRLLKKVINGIVSLFKVLGENYDIDFSSDTQKKMLIIDFKNLIDKFNNKINWQIENAQYNCAVQNWSLPPWFALSNTINTNNHIKEIANYKYVFEQIESNELLREYDEFGLTTAST